MKCAKSWEKSCPRGVRRRGSRSARRMDFHGLWRGRSVRLANNLEFLAVWLKSAFRAALAAEEAACPECAFFSRFEKSRPVWRVMGEPRTRVLSEGFLRIRKCILMS